MKYLNFLLFGLLIIISCNSQSNKKKQSTSIIKEHHQPTLKKVWTSDQFFRTPESVIYNNALNEFYVSNVNQNPWNKDGDGFISILSSNGEIKNLKWIEGLDGPKGMGIIDKMLYVANIDEVVQIDISKGEIVNRIGFEDEMGLNDITVGDLGELYVSSSANSRIYRIIDGQVEMIFQGKDEGFNGLLFDAGHLLILTTNSHQLLKLDLDEKKIVPLVEDLGSGDGVVAVGDGTYLCSNWLGEVYFITHDLKSSKILDTKKDKINSADIEFVEPEKILVVPTFWDNRVVAYKLIE